LDLRPGEKETPSRDGAARSRRGPDAADEADPLLFCGGGEVSPTGGVAGPCSGSEAPRSGRVLWRGESPGEQRPPNRGDPGSARTDSQGEEGFEAGEAGGTGGLRSLVQGDREADLASAEREPIAAGGTRQLRESVDVGETGGERPRRRAVQHVGG